MNVGPGGGGGFLQGGGNSASAATIGEKTAIYADNSALEQADTATATVTENNRKTIFRRSKLIWTIQLAKSTLI